MQKENSKLKQKIDVLEESKSSLEQNLNNMNDDSGKQNGEINSMLGKIESILSSDTSPIAQQPTISFGEIEEIVVSKPEQIEEDKTKELDLDRMERLLGGLN